MTLGTAERRRNPLPAAHSVSTPSPSISLATDASTVSPSQGGRNRRKIGGREPVTPPTAPGGSAWQGVAPCDSEAPVLLGATRGRTVLWSSRAERATGRDLETTFLLRAAAGDRHDDDTFVAT
jgi:hypothetical protein